MIRLLTAALLVLGAGYLYAANPTSPTLRPLQVGDSVRVVATWRNPCDARGCADSTRVTWRAGTAAPLTRTLARTTDTLWIKAPAWGDSVRVAIEVSTIRRRLVSDLRTASVIVRRLDAPPPPVDSLRVDTLELRRQLAAIALRDSFPSVAIRDTLGGRSGSIPVGGSLDLCVIGRNRYTGVVAVLVDDAVPEDVASRIERQCERARALVASERSG